MSIEHYKVTLTAVGPVFVGSGNDIMKFEYVYDRQSDTVYVIDTLKLFGTLQKPSGLQEKFEQHINRNRNLSEFFRDNGLQQQSIRLAKYSYKAGGDPRNNNIREFVKNAYGQPYVPGSSLKGAVRTAILYGIIQDYYDRSKFPIERNNISEIVVQYETAYDFKQKKRCIRDIGAEAGKFERKKLHTLTLDEKHPENAVNSIMRGLRISDSEPLSVNDLCLCKKCDLLKNGEIKSPNLLRECIRPGTRIHFEMDIDDRYFTPGADFLDKCFEIYYNKQREQMNFFDELGKNPKPAPTEHYIVLGGGSGYVSKTFTHMIMGKKVTDEKALKTVSAIMTQQFGKHGHDKDVNKGVSPHTRKMTKYKNEYVDIGVCRVDIDKI